MRSIRRLLSTLLLFTTIHLSGICDVILPPPLLDELDGTFLSQLVRYLETISDFGGSDLEVDLLGKLPAVAAGEAIDFFLTDEAGGYFSVLYRGKGSASYRRAAISVKQVKNEEEKQIGETEEGKETSASSEVFTIRKGQLVTISFTSGAIRLDVQGEAMESSFGKDRIRVKMIETGKEFVGSISGALEVRVDL